MTVRLALRLEGAAVAIAALLLYAHQEYSWLALALLWLVPDVERSVISPGTAWARSHTT